jgi:hypothetical protein
MLSLPPMDVLQANKDHFSAMVDRSTITVAIGVALEGVELIHDSVTWVKRWRFGKKESAVLKELATLFPAGPKAVEAESSANHPRWVRRLTRVGLILVVVGVLGEWRYGGKLEDANNSIHKLDVASLINLAICSSPRVIPAEAIFMPTGNLTATADPVRRFARQVSIEYVREPETKRAALNLRLALESVGWRATAFTPVDELPDDGVEIEPFMAPSWETSSTIMWEEELDSWNAAEAVVDFLHSYNWQARMGWPVNEKGEAIRDPKIFPPNNLHIKVGLYPAVIYVSPSGAKEFSKAYAEFEKENKRRLATIEPLEAEAEKKLLAQLTQKQAEVYKARQEHAAKIREQRIAQFSGSCQPLEPNPFPRP